MSHSMQMTQAFIVRHFWWIFYGILVTANIMHVQSSGQFVYYPDVADHDSYVNFDFSSLRSILSQHRTVGLPALVWLYGKIFGGLDSFIYFHYVVYQISVGYLLWCLLRARVHGVVTLVLLVCTVWNWAIRVSIPFVATEILTLAGINALVGYALLIESKPKWMQLITLSGCIFALSMIRPNMVTWVGMIPAWHFVRNVLLVRVVSIKDSFVASFKMLAVLAVPILLFSVLRWAVVGQFNVVGMPGGLRIGHALAEMTELDVLTLPVEDQALASELVAHKRRLGGSCGVAPSGSLANDPATKQTIHGYCFGPYVMTSWLDVIKLKKGQVVDPDPDRQLAPWMWAISLSGFYTKYCDSELDDFLNRIATPILKAKARQFREWVVYGSWAGLVYMSKVFIVPLFDLMIFVLAASSLCLAVLIFNGVNVRNLYPDTRDVAYWVTVAGTMFAVGYIPIVLFNTVFIFRLYYPLVALLTPVLMLGCWVLPSLLYNMVIFVIQKQGPHRTS